MIVDANLLIYSVDADSDGHEAAAAWLISCIGSKQSLLVPWQTIGAFVRIVTHPRIYDQPMSASTAWSQVETWLEQPAIQLAPVRRGAIDAYRSINDRYAPAGNLVPDAMLAAMALDYGAPLASADRDFARFAEIEWVNPLEAS